MCVWAAFLAAVTIRVQHLISSELPIVRLLFQGSVYSKKDGTYSTSAVISCSMGLTHAHPNFSSIKLHTAM